MKFTKANVTKITAPDPSGRQRLIWDADLKGFGMLVSGSTSSRTWVVQKSLPDGTRRRITIGPVNVLPVEDARKRAIALLAEFASGKDPKAERRQRAERDVTLQQALDTYLRTNKRLRPSSAALYRRAIGTHLASWLNRPLRAITPDMIEARHAAIAAEIMTRARHRMERGEVAANGVMAALRSVWNDAADRIPDLPMNPTRRLRRGRWFKVEERSRIIPRDGMLDWFCAVDALPSRVLRDYLLLLLFTGMRRREASGLRWEEVNFGERLICIPGSRTKSKRELKIPMSSFVRDLLVARRALGNANGFVFAGNGKTGHLCEPKLAITTVTAQTGIKFSPHDLRRSYITTAEACDLSMLVLKALVGHSVNDVTARYARLDIERLREPAQRVCDKLMQLCQIEPVAGEGVAKIG